MIRASGDAASRATLKLIGEADSRVRTVIESPYGTRIDGTRCSPEEVARNEHYLNRCIRDSLARNEAPYASHGFFTVPGRLDDNDPQQRRTGIAAGIAWGDAGLRCAVYLDYGITAGMRDGILAHRARGIEIVERFIGLNVPTPRGGR